MSKALKALLAALMALLLLGACGDDDDAADDDVSSEVEDEEGPSIDEEDSAEDEVADSEFVQEAKAVCMEANTKAQADFTAYFESHPEFKDAQNISDLPEDAQEEVVGLITAVFSDLIDDLRSLEPEGQEDEWAALLDDFEAKIDSFDDDPAAAFEGDPFADIDTKLADFGLQECGG